MPATAYYLYHVMNTQLDIWDQLIETSSPFVPTGISPSPSPTLTSNGVNGVVSMAPVNKLLDAKDLSHRLPRGNDFVSSSASSHQMLHRGSCPLGCTIRHGDELPPGRPDFKQYTVHWDEDSRRFVWGAGNAMPQGLPEHIRRGLLMANMCDWGVFLLKPSVEKVVKLIDHEAEVHWMVVVPRRRAQFVTPDDPGSNTLRHIATAHSVLLIRSPLAGNFVLDPTTEQYGNPREHRFLAWRDYKNLYILRKSQWIGEAVWTTQHDWEWMFDIGDSPSAKYWHAARAAVGKCVDAWLGNVQAGGESLRKAVDDVSRYQHEASRLALNIRRRMRQAERQPAF